MLENMSDCRSNLESGFQRMISMGKQERKMRLDLCNQLLSTFSWRLSELCCKCGVKIVFVKLVTTVCDTEPVTRVSYVSSNI